MARRIVGRGSPADAKLVARKGSRVRVREARQKFETDEVTGAWNYGGAPVVPNIEVPVPERVPV